MKISSYVIRIYLCVLHIRKHPHNPYSLFHTFLIEPLNMANFLFFIAFFFLYFASVHSASFTTTNKCSYTVWPGMLSGAGTAPLATTGFALQPGESNTFSVPTSWSGRLWGRTLCSSDSTGKFSCATGDCGSGTVECNGNGGAPPTSLAEFTLNGADGMDFYDVSLVDGYNLPMLVEAQGGTRGNCTSTGCAVDLNSSCPNELKVVGADGGCVACKSACEAFRDDMYCCSGPYANPNTCKPTSYSEFFKSACPRAYSYAFDDGTSTFTCASANYVITFCPDPANGRKTIGGGGGNVSLAARARSTATTSILMACSIVAAFVIA